jgi:hypothetical protein
LKLSRRFAPRSLTPGRSAAHAKTPEGLMALYLGSRSIEEVHEQAILLWIHAKTQDRTIDPAHGIYFALTDQTWPPGTPEVSNAIELCSVLNQAYGQPPLTAEQTKALNLKAAALFIEYERGGGPIRATTYIAWANGIGYVLAVIATAVSGFSFWVVGLAVTVWLCYGAARTAARMRREEARPDWEVPVIATMHLISLVALYVVTVIRLVSQ